MDSSFFCHLDFNFLEYKGKLKGKNDSAFIFIHYEVVLFFFTVIRVYFLRADALRDKQSSLKDKFSNLKSLQPQPQRETTSDSDDSDFDEFLDWRAKKVS